ncbi:hypothetical protein, partial [uncultured Mucilaginibacter sp.]|uniref:hypothetical protein n=1 Tax=uncultured Mucilaginibacter sp. TaxID=797541 RepID=UPI0025D72B3F
MKNSNTPKYCHIARLIILLVFLVTFANQAFCQAEVEPWGNINGIRKKGQLFNFESSIVVVKGNQFISTGKERQQPHYKRSGDDQIITTNIDSLFIKEVVTDLSGGRINVTVTLNAHAAIVNDGIFFCLTLPGEGSMRFSGSSEEFKHFVDAGRNYDGLANGGKFKTSAQKITVKFANPEAIRIRKDTTHGKNELKFYVALKLNGLRKGEILQ